MKTEDWMQTFTAITVSSMNFMWGILLEKYRSRKNQAITNPSINDPSRLIVRKKTSFLPTFLFVIGDIAILGFYAFHTAITIAFVVLVATLIGNIFYLLIMYRISRILDVITGISDLQGGIIGKLNEVRNDVNASLRANWHD